MYRATQFAGSLAALICTLGITGCGGAMDSAAPPSATTGPSGTNPPPPTPTSSAPTVSVEPTTIYVGQSATLTWSVNGTANSTCTASGAWSGTPPQTSVVTPTAAGTNVYTISCTVAGSPTAATASATLTVKPAASGPGQYALTTLVSDTAAGGGVSVDPDLRNPWAISVDTFGYGLDVTSSGSRTSSHYDTQGNVLGTVTFPADFVPTGIVNLGDNEGTFPLGANCLSRFVYASTAGTLAGWSLSGSPVVMYTATDNAVYTGLTGIFFSQPIFAADFHNGKIDVIDGSWTKQTPSPTSYAFADPALPPNYAPFGIQAVFLNGSCSTGICLPNEIVVTYAQRDPQSPDEPLVGAGLGLVDVFDVQGNFMKRLISPGGALNAPWGVALAPASFGQLSNTLLIGNFGDGKINAYDPTTGQFIASVSDTTGAAIVLPGLRGITFCDMSEYGCAGPNQSQYNVLFFAAASDATHGSVGKIYQP